MDGSAHHEIARPARPTDDVASATRQRPAAATVVADTAGSPARLTIGAIVALQPSVGNAALARVLRAPAGAGVDHRLAVTRLQRVVHGLATEAKTDAYVADAHRFWVDPANGARPLRALCDALFDSVNAALPCPCGLDYRKLGVDGQFNSTAWQIWVDVDALSKRPDVAAVGDLTHDEVANVANTLYHEARHAEQHFLIARRRAGQGQSAQDIADDLKIPAAVADAAARSPLQGITADDDAQLADADAWDRFFYEKYLPYTWAVHDIENAAEGVKNAADKDSGLELFADIARALAYQAYRAYAHERDAFAVGEAAARKFKETAAPPAAAKVVAGSTATAAVKADPAQQAKQIELVKGGLVELRQARVALEASPQKDELDRDVLDRAAAIADAGERLVAFFEGRPMPGTGIADETPAEADDAGDPPLVAITAAMASVIASMRVNETAALLLADIGPHLSTASVEYGALEDLPASAMAAITAAYDDVFARITQLEAGQTHGLAGTQDSPLGKAAEALRLACVHAPLVAIAEAMASVIESIRAHDPQQQTAAMLLADIGPHLSTASVEYGALDGPQLASMPAITAAYDEFFARIAELEAGQTEVVAGSGDSPLGRAAEAFRSTCLPAEGR
jgi:hypothetical protein